MSLVFARKNLRVRANKKNAVILQRFFKTGKGEYGEGDIFLGLRSNDIKEIARKYPTLGLQDIQTLLLSKIHEERVLALRILVQQYHIAEESRRKKIFDFYIQNRRGVNNWDLVDMSAYHIVGHYIEKREKKLLYRLARSHNMWDRRIAIISTFHYIKKGDPKETLKIAQMLLHDKEDLIHKAVGWMLREVGKRCKKGVLELFLDRYKYDMPRTMLRYAIERFPKEQRRQYLLT